MIESVFVAVFPALSYAVIVAVAPVAPAFFIADMLRPLKLQDPVSLAAGLTALPVPPTGVITSSVFPTAISSVVTPLIENVFPVGFRK